MKKIILIVTVMVIVLMCFSGCGGKDASHSSPIESGGVNTKEANIEKANTKTENVFTDDELKAYIIGRKLDCNYKRYREGEESLKEDNFYVLEITELTYDVTEIARSETTATVNITGTFEATGAMFSDKDATKTTYEPISFSVFASSYSNGISFNDFQVLSDILIRPIEPIDLNNLIQYTTFRNETMDLSAPNMRIALTCTPMPDNNCIGIFTTCDIYEGDTFITSEKISVSQVTKPNISFWRD